MQRILLTLIATLSIALVSCVDQKENVPKPRPDAAARGLATIRDLAAGGGFGRLGFDSLAQSLSDSLGRPFKVYYIALDELQFYLDTINAHDMLIDIRRLMYPVGPDTAPHSFIVLEGDDSLGYVSASFGGPNVVRRYSHARNVMAAAPYSFPVDSLILIQIPALNLAFIGGDDAKGSLQLMNAIGPSAFITSLGDTVRVDTAVVYTASGMLDTLRQVAQDHPGGPR